MNDGPLEIATLDELRSLVTATLSSFDYLEEGAFPLTEKTLTRGGKPCGMYFCLHGPRATKFTAVWETDSNTVLFYGADGQRALRSQLTAAPPLPQVA